ncbi:MAG: hypothetical protein WCX30_03810 [Candidatus Paceibacterota bacterium]|jgi:hypothetical protein|nr:hypothetical protein [bacterium]
MEKEEVKSTFNFGQDSDDLNKIINLCIKISELIKKGDCSGVANFYNQLSSLIREVAKRSKTDVLAVEGYLLMFNDFRRLAK